VLSFSLADGMIAASDPEGSCAWLLLGGQGGSLALILYILLDKI